MQPMNMPSRVKIVVGKRGPYVSGPGYHALREAVLRRSPVQELGAARAALTLDPDCIDALLVFARSAKDSGEALPFLTRAVRSGDELWMPVAAYYGGGMDWWGCAGARPYLDALTMLGDAHYCLDNRPAALWCFNRLLRMAPPDEERGELEERVRELSPTPAAAMGF